jgi:hypothetical protein
MSIRIPRAVSVRASTGVPRPAGPSLTLPRATASDFLCRCRSALPTAEGERRRVLLTKVRHDLFTAPVLCEAHSKGWTTVKKAVAVALGTSLLLYSSSYFSRTDGAWWVNHHVMSAPPAIQQRPSTRDLVVLPSEPLVTGSISAAAATPPEDETRPLQRRSHAGSKRSTQPTPREASERESLVSAQQHARDPIQFSLADRGN